MVTKTTISSLKCPYCKKWLHECNCVRAKKLSKEMERLTTNNYERFARTKTKIVYVNPTTCGTYKPSVSRRTRKRRSSGGSSIFGM